jgi:hypothetical protein
MIANQSSHQRMQVLDQRARRCFVPGTDAPDAGLHIESIGHHGDWVLGGSLPTRRNKRQNSAAVTRLFVE